MDDQDVSAVAQRQAALVIDDDHEGASIYLDDVEVVRAAKRHGSLQVNWLIYGPVWPHEAQSLMTEFIHLTAWLAQKQGAVTSAPQVQALAKRKRRSR